MAKNDLHDRGASRLAGYAPWPLVLGLLMIGICAPQAARATSAAQPLSEGGAPAAESKIAVIKLDPLVANLDEGDQLRYVKIILSLEINTEAQPKIVLALPRARHESIMYLSGLHLTDVQGQLGRQRIYRELQRRIADALGTGLRRIYFDEFVVQ